jgi:FKBP-type peptidyl-prolyl cis-trans isomerase SlyD
MTDVTGKALLASGEKTFSYLHGREDNVAPPIESALEGKQVGDRVHLTLQPEDAFGEYDVRLVHTEARANFPEEVAIGMEFSGGRLPVLDDEALRYRVIDVDDAAVTVDANHPLAGKTLRVDCVVVDIRAASEAEIQQGKLL